MPGVRTTHRWEASITASSLRWNDPASARAAECDTAMRDRFRFPLSALSGICSALLRETDRISLWLGPSEPAGTRIGTRLVRRARGRRPARRSRGGALWAGAYFFR